MHLYLVHCLVNDKYYVGKTVNSIADRWYHHVWDAHHQYKNANTPLHNAIRKYGSDSFRTHSLGSASTNDELNNLEKLWIITLRSYDKKVGYNASFGGDGGGVPTEDTRARLRARKSYWRGKKHSESTKETMRKPHTKFSLETRENLSRLRRGIPWSESRRQASGKEFGRNASAKKLYS